MADVSKEKVHGVFQCTYRGFIHADSPDVKSVPGLAAVQKAHDMLNKKNIKKTRKLHPLFGRGFDTPLDMMIQAGAVRVDLPASGKAPGAVVMNTQLHKIAFLANVANAVGLVVKRPGMGKFKCHLFLFEDAKKAEEVSRLLMKVTNDAFKLLHRVSMRLRKKQTTEGPPQIASRKPSLADDDQPWFHGPLSRPQAEDILMDFAAVNGLFLVRQREGTSNEYAISFLVNGMVFHNRILKMESGEFVNSKGTVFPNLRLMVAEYQNKHPDMQCILTEYVPRDRVQSGGVEYVNAALINEARAQRVASSLSRWSELDVREALQDLEEIDVDNPTGLQPDDEKDSTEKVEFDPIFDDIRFGFGNEFVSLVMSGNTEVLVPSEEVDLDNDCFDLSEMMTQLDQEDEC
eukprot:m.69834 g.69834  ORF g.69834 m.69834 type:complete len:403 (-) comp13751_c0_seq1:161-1369(-)